MSGEGDSSNVIKCPFCGGSDVMVGRDIETNEWYIKCFGCGTSTSDTIDDMINEALERR